MPEAQARNRVLGWVALTLILCPTLIRVLVLPNSMPWWDTDPSINPPTGTAITPMGVLTLDLVTILGAALAAWSASHRVLPGSVLFAAGSVGVLIHASGESEHLVVAGPWVSGVAAMLGAAWLARDPVFRGVLLGLGLGVVLMFLARAVVQVWVDHPMTVAHFQENKEQVLSLRGWAPGSPQALMYERRLTQPVATGWFGLSNVLATFAAAAGVFGLVSAIIVKDSKSRAVLIGLAAAGFITLWLTGSKGGWGAAMIGLLASTAFALCGRAKTSRGVRGFLPLACGLGMLGLVGVRGLIGERSGELSLLFRAQYLEAAVRIFSQHPLTGVGPASFQDAYLQAKNPLNPEEVTSPHSVLFDWFSTLGLFALPWALLLVRAVVFSPPANASEAEPSLTPDPKAGHPPPLSPFTVRFITLLPIAVFACSAWFERDLLLPLDLGARFIGLVAWILISLTIARASSRMGPGVMVIPGVGLAAVLFTHLQIELTPVHVGAAPLAFVLIGAALPRSTESMAKQGRIEKTVAALLILSVLGGAMLVGVRPLMTWERHLRDASEPMVLAGARLSLDPNIDPGLVLVPARTQALESLARAIDARPNHTKTRIEASQLALSNALHSRASHARWIDSARGWIETGESVDARSMSWLATLELVLIEQGLASEPDDSRLKAIEWLVASHELDPYNAGRAMKLADLNLERGHHAEAARWAQIALDLNELFRLDKLKQFTESDTLRLHEMTRVP